jgi:class 3 adenylate cyclase
MTDTGSGDRPTLRPDTPAPSVTHGFLFADLRGYTRYVDAHGDHAAADLLDRYRTLVRGAVASFRGAEIKTEGDSFYVVFDSVSAAARCGLAIVEAATATAVSGVPSWNVVSMIRQRMTFGSACGTHGPSARSGTASIRASYL